MVRVPGASCILKNVSFSIISNNKELKILNEHISTYEMKYERNSPILIGFLIFTDMYDIIKSIDVKEARIQVYFNDVFNKSFIRYFRVIDAIESYDKMKSKHYLFSLVDEISYKLSNIYISKSFQSSKVIAFKQLLNEYNINGIISENKLKTLIEVDSNNENFVIPKNVSVLDFFISEFNKIGYSFYQTRDGFYIRKFDNILPSKLEEIKDPFLYNTTNQMYKNLIYEFDNTAMSGNNILNNPNHKSYFFDPEKKQILSIDKTYDDLKNDMTINNNNISLQQNVGSLSSFQNRLDANQHSSNIKENALNTFKVVLVVNGYNINDINKIYNVQLPGHKGNVKSQYEGNIHSSGKYVSLTVVDKLIGDKLIQKITLGRSDSQK